MNKEEELGNVIVGLNRVVWHIRKVQRNMNSCVLMLLVRANKHDNSKFDDEEKELLINKAKLDGIEFGTAEYENTLLKVDKAIQHHYRYNDHHPQYHENGIQDMNLLSLLEMICDWQAAAPNDYSFEKSLEYNKTRFNISDELADILLNTAVELGWC